MQELEKWQRLALERKSQVEAVLALRAAEPHLTLVEASRLVLSFPEKYRRRIKLKAAP